MLDPLLWVGNLDQLAPDRTLQLVPNFINSELRKETYVTIITKNMKFKSWISCMSLTDYQNKKHVSLFQF